MTDEPIKAGKPKKEAAKMTFGLMFLSLLYQDSQVVEFTFEPESPDYSFIWFLGILAVVLFPVFFWWIRRQNRS